MTTADAVRALVRPLFWPRTRTGEVAAVSGTDSCTVELPSGVQLYNVRLRAAIDGQATGFVPVPKVGSKAVVQALNDQQAQWQLLSCTQVDKLLLGGDQWGGLLDAQAVLDAVNDNADAINAIANALRNGATTPQDGGAGYKSSIVSALSSLQTGMLTNDNINPKILHGDG